MKVRTTLLLGICMAALTAGVIGSVASAAPSRSANSALTVDQTTVLDPFTLTISAAGNNATIGIAAAKPRVRVPIRPSMRSPWVPAIPGL